MQPHLAGKLYRSVRGGKTVWPPSLLNAELRSPGAKQVASPQWPGDGGVIIGPRAIAPPGWSAVVYFWFPS